VEGVKRHLPVKLIVGLIFSQESLFEKTETLLSRKFGDVDFRSPILSFNHTDYYEKEFGKNLKRNFLSFNKLVKPEGLAKIKLYTNRIEDRFRKEEKRQINIDPGYLTDSKLILATTKNFRHRIYLKKGVYAEVTLYYAAGSFHPWEWTYPDYKTKGYIEIFNQIRRIYIAQRFTV
jgi:hypothetical protein